ncbi:MAG: hypothetical protein EB078_11360 [Proteobacteria bacterium]|nr:hypothetical protein [Pseudomonadota bacterium]NDD05496.1 hypothetical protein [Pseudomonadota bacterium]
MGCGRLCQSPEGTIPTSITSVEWALRNTADPNFRTQSFSLDNQNFVKMTLAPNYTGQVKKVVQNSELAPTAFVYDIPATGVLCMENIPGTSSNSQNPNGATLRQLCRAGLSGVHYYTYQLSTKGLTLTDRDSGYSYEFWLYKGAIAPDNMCSFK